MGLVAGNSASGGDGDWSLQLASSILGLLCPAARVPLLGNPLQFHPSAFSAGRKAVNRPCFYPESWLLSSFMCVCSMQAHTCTWTFSHLTLWLTVVCLQVKQPSGVSPALSNLLDLPWNFGLQLRFHSPGEAYGQDLAMGVARSRAGCVRTWSWPADSSCSLCPFLGLTPPGMTLVEWKCHLGLF